MKIISIILGLFLMYLNGFSQKNRLTKTWINSNNEALIIEDSFVHFQKPNIGFYKYDYRLSHDTLYMIEYRYTDTKEYPTETPYLILSLSRDNLKLLYNKWQGNGTYIFDTLIYSDSSIIKSKIISFDKLLIQCSFISSKRIKTKLEIDRKGNVYYWDKNKVTNYYHYVLPVNTLYLLNKLIAHSRIENLPTNELQSSGIHFKNYSITIMNKNETIRKSFSRTPYLNQELMSFFYNLTRTIENKDNLITNFQFME